MSETKKVLLVKDYEVTGLSSFHKVIPVGIYEVVGYANVYKIVSDGIYKGDNLPKEICKIAKEYAIEYVTKLEIKAAKGEQENVQLRKDLEDAWTTIREYGIPLMAAKNLCKEIDQTGSPKDNFTFRAIAKNLKVLVNLIDWKAIDSLTRGQKGAKNQ